MPDGFKVVKGRRRKKRQSCDTFSESNLNITADSFITGKLKKAVNEFESSQLSFDLSHSVDECLSDINKSSISEIICYGLGNFLTSKHSLHQLAALLTLHKTYNSVVHVYDPVFTSSEIEILQSLNFEIILENEKGKRKVTESGTNLIFLPHCPKELINNFLWANWNVSVKNCILITNSFSSIIDNTTKKSVQKSLKYIFKIQPKTKEIILKDSYHIEGVFNDTSVHHFNHCELDTTFFIDSLEEEPSYTGQIELVTEDIQQLTIEDE